MRNFLSIVAIMALGITGLNATGTDAGTVVNNTATLSFDVGGVTQDTVDSNEDTFVVDRKIDVVIAVNNSAKDTQPSAQGVKLNFEVANEGNDAETWTLSLAENSSDDFDVDVLADCHLFDSNGSDLGTFSQDIAFSKDENKTFDVACDIPSDATDTQNAEIFLVATIKNRTDNTNEADTQGSVENVYAEGASDNSDVAYDGHFSKGGTYHIVSATLSFEKTSMVISDELGSATPHRIPGATVRYCFDINNTGSTTAQKVRLTEDLTVDNKDDLDYVKSGIIIQDIGTCDCTALTDTSGTATASSTAVYIPEDANGIDIAANKQACGYLEAVVK